MKATAEKDGDAGTVTLFNTNGTVSSVHYFDLTDEVELGEYATMLVDHIGGGGIKKR